MCFIVIPFHPAIGQSNNALQGFVSDSFLQDPIAPPKKPEPTNAITSSVPSPTEAPKPKRQEIPVATTTQTLSEALQQSYENNPTLQAARAQFQAIQEQLPQAYSGLKPTVLGEASVINTDIDGSNFGGATGSTAKDVIVSVNQPLFRGGTTFANIRAAKAVIAAQESELKRIEQNVLLDAVTAYMDVIRDQALLRLNNNNRDLIQKSFTDTQNLFEVGEVTKTDVSQTVARLARADSDIINAQGALKTSEATFQQIIGFAPESLQKQNTSYFKSIGLDEAISIAETNNPAVLTAMQAHKASQEGVDSIFGELLPSLDLSGSWNRTEDPSPGLIDEQTTRAIGVVATIPLYQAGSVRSRVREAKHTSNQRLMQVTEVKRAIRQNVISAWENLQTINAEIISRKAEVEAAQIAREGVNAEARFGSRTILDALDSDQELLNAQTALVVAERDQLVAEFTLAALLGQITPNLLAVR